MSRSAIMLCVEPHRTLEISQRQAGERLDALLARELGVSRGYVRRLLARGLATIDGRPAAKGTVLRAGDRIDLEPFRHPSEGPATAPEIPIRILAEGHGYVAVDKPAGLPSCPLDFDESHTALGAVAALRPAVLEAGEGVERGAVHRLDTDTSGVLVLATEPEAWRRARAAFAARQVDKRYLARVHGRLDRAADVALRLEQRGDRVAVVAGGGRETLSRIEPLEPGDESSLVEVRPATGMRHQIRATLAHLGHPVLGDRVYGSALALGRHLLHASFIRIARFEAASETPDEVRRYAE